MNIVKLILVIILLFAAALLFGWVFGWENMKWLIAWFVNTVAHYYGLRYFFLIWLFNITIRKYLILHFKTALRNKYNLSITIVRQKDDLTWWLWKSHISDSFISIKGGVPKILFPIWSSFVRIFWRSFFSTSQAVPRRSKYFW